MESEDLYLRGDICTAYQLQNYRKQMPVSATVITSVQEEFGLCLCCTMLRRPGPPLPPATPESGARPHRWLWWPLACPGGFCSPFPLAGCSQPTPQPATQKRQDPNLCFCSSGAEVSPGASPAHPAHDAPARAPSCGSSVPRCFSSLEQPQDLSIAYTEPTLNVPLSQVSWQFSLPLLPTRLALTCCKQATLHPRPVPGTVLQR